MAAQPCLGPPAAPSTPAMTSREKALWAMSSDELYQQARCHSFGNSKFGRNHSQSKKSGRVRILKWILEKEGFTPYVAPRETASAATYRGTSPRHRNRNGAIDQPEAIPSQTSDPVLQRQIDEANAKYLEWTAEALATLAMKRSYQVFKDSAGKMPTRAKPALARWHAAWDVLKSPREKRWWLGDGIDLVNKAKAMGYCSASTKKYDVIVWLRSTPEDAEVLTAHVAVPSAPAGASQRPARESRRPGGWKRGFTHLLDETGGESESSERRGKKSKVSSTTG